MVRSHGPFRQTNPWRRIAFGVCAGLTAGTAFFGFLILPLAGTDQSSAWRKICAAFGARTPRIETVLARPVFASTVAWTFDEVAAADGGHAEHGKEVAQSCAACHGRDGINTSGWIPNLAGMRAEALVKQLTDFKTGHRRWPVMNAIGAALDANDIRDVAAYYASLAPAATVASLERNRSKSPYRDDAIERLVFFGDPRRAIAPCASCHGLDGLKRAAPTLAGQQASYVERELASFQARYRTNDEGEQMRVAARLTPDEMNKLANYLAFRHVDRGDK